MRDPVTTDLTGRQAVGRAIRAAREASGLSLRDAAAQLGMSHGWLGMIEQGERALSCHDLPRVAEALGTTAEQLAKQFSENLSTFG